MESVVRDALRRHFGRIDDEYAREGNLIPDLYTMLSRLLNDRDLPDEHRPYVVGALGTLCLPYTILEDPGRNALALTFLTASVCRRIAQHPDGDQIIDRNWPRDDRPSDVLSEVISRGNEELDESEIMSFYNHAGFEARG
jgi:hypothetical protein